MAITINSEEGRGEASVKRELRGKFSANLSENLFLHPFSIYNMMQIKQAVVDSTEETVWNESNRVQL